MFLDFSVYKSGIYLDWDGDTKVCLFNFANKDIVCWEPSYIDFKGIENAVSAGKYALELASAKVGAPYNYFKRNILTRVFLTLGKTIGMVWVRTSFILSNRQSGNAGKMKLSCVCIGHTHLTSSYIL